MNRLTVRKAFTSAELVVVAACVALLAAILLPTVGVNAKHRRATSCLANLGRLGAASLMYAAEDPREQIVPLHKMQVLMQHANGFCGFWSWRTALPFSFGGQTATTPFPAECGELTVLQDDMTWGIKTRPLNPYFGGGVAGEFGWEEVFHCPADVGYPALDPDEFPDYLLDAPNEAAGIPCFDFLGNSYRSNGCGIIWLVTASLVNASFITGTEGHTPASIGVPTETVLYSNPLFYWWTRLNPDEFPDPTVLEFPGWHGQIMADNVAYCDGSARTTEIGELYEWSEEELEEMGVCPEYFDSPSSFLRRGPTWRMDTYPSPGALIKTYGDYGCFTFWPDNTSFPECWPFDNYTENECPY